MRVTLFLLLSIAVAHTADAKLYRWVDEDGKVHYSDKIPPSAIEKPHAKLDKRGLILEKRGRAKTPEEIAREKERKRLQAEQQRLLEEQKARDRVLLKTFRSEDDIILARDGKLATYDAQIRIAYKNIERLKAWLTTQKKKAADLERGGKKLPKKLATSIKNTRQQIKSNYASILRQEEDKNFIRKKYAADLKRFRELKELTTAIEQEKESEKRAGYNAIVETVIPCENGIDCDQAWQKAKAYARKHANTPIYVDAERMFMTQPARKQEDLSITVSRLRPEKDQPELIFMDITCRKQVATETWCQKGKARNIRKNFRKEVLGKE